MEWTFGLRARECATNSERILGRASGQAQTKWPLFGLTASRTLETSVAAQLPPHALMERAGLALARLAMAIAPHASVIWIPCGPGNNGGDGFEAACHLKQWGKTPLVSYIPGTHPLPVDASEARNRATLAGVTVTDTIPSEYDLCIDAIFGMGTVRNIGMHYAAWMERINSGAAPVISVDLPSGLNAENGIASELCVKADFTLCFLTLKPGLFTADGRHFCGEIWFNSLDITQNLGGRAQLNAKYAPPPRAHNTHKGSYGDVGVVGGAPGMAGAALLAAKAALHGGAGRVYLASLDPNQAHIDTGQPEIMFRFLQQMQYASMTVVAGCGGGTAIHEHLHNILGQSDRLVLDADALNTIATAQKFEKQLCQRKSNTTVLTPHPLEAARLMGITCAEVQAGRIAIAQAMADRFSCTVVLKGSGTVIAAPGKQPRINTSGNARLASAGTGDVLAGLIGARIAAHGDAFQAACEAVYWHGHVSQKWQGHATMTAIDLALAL